MKGLGGVNVRFSAIACCLWLLTLTTISSADPLPFRDGRYVVDLALCQFPDSELDAEYGDGIDAVVRHIEGNYLDDTYEGSCELTSVSEVTAEKDVTFTASCSAEGETYQRSDTYKFINTTSFSQDGLVFRRCPALLEKANQRDAPFYVKCEPVSEGSSITISIADHSDFDRTFHCLRADFIVDMSSCGPQDGYALSSPTGAPVVIGVVDDWRDYRDHLGGVTQAGVGEDSMYFAGGFMSSAGYEPKWSFRANRFTGEAELKLGTDATGHEYACRKAEQQF